MVRKRKKSAAVNTQGFIHITQVWVTDIAAPYFCGPLIFSEEVDLKTLN